MKVVLVDDHPLLRSGLRQVLEQQANLAVIGEAGTGQAALQLISELTPDLVVMDVHLPDLDGIEVTRCISHTHPTIRTVIFSADTDRAQVDKALQAGACGYIVKESVADQLIQAIHLISEGKLYLSPELSAGILADYRQSLWDQETPAKPRLTERERQLLRLIAEGHRNKEIAVALGVSAKSIETYRSRLMKKLQCPSAVELVRYAIREGITSA